MAKGTTRITLSADELAIIKTMRANLSGEEMAALAGGPPISSVNQKLVVDRTHDFFEALLMFVAAQGNCSPADIHLGWGTVDGKLSLGVVPVTEVVDGKTERRIALQRRKQEQIGLGDGAKWAMPTGGFTAASRMESADNAIRRHALMKGGVQLGAQKYPLVYLITKQPYGVTNEGYVKADGKVTSGYIYGNVGRALLTVDDDDRAHMIAYAASRGEELRFVTEAEFKAILDSGNHTLDGNEQGFLQSLLARQLMAGPERQIVQLA